MILMLRSPDLLAPARAAALQLGLEYQSVSLAEGGSALEIAVDSAPVPPSVLQKTFGIFGELRGFNNKTPLLDALPEDFSVEVQVSGAAPVVFRRWSMDPIFIAGPCSLDKKELLQENARELSRMGVRVLRGGALKPRTSPHDYQGIGREGYRWLAEVAHEYGMAAVSEALSEDDVPEALEHLDMIQVGARNMQNFALLKKLGRGHRPVLLKRAPGATLKEWASAAEYLLASGNNQVVLCERGVRGLERELRYTLDLAGVAWMQTRFALPVVVDPSHGTGTKQIISACAAAALAIPAAGVMVETHPQPCIAKSDANQALTLAEFASLKAKCDAFILS